MLVSKICSCKQYRYKQLNLPKMKTVILILSGILVNGILFAQATSGDVKAATRTEVQAETAVSASAKGKATQAGKLKKAAENKATTTAQSNIETTSNVSAKAKKESQQHLNSAKSTSLEVTNRAATGTSSQLKAGQQKAQQVKPGVKVNGTASVAKDVKVAGPKVQVKTKVNTSAGVRIQ